MGTRLDVLGQQVPDHLSERHLSLAGIILRSVFDPIVDPQCNGRLSRSAIAPVHASLTISHAIMHTHAYSRMPSFDKDTGRQIIIFLGIIVCE
ncbi:hypothetical protein [Azospirillum canadense]|uniref:hypothetical protein n=1 Tax=Azospirillum canadense TaxID=403962 RepID=UPI002225EC4A|nr:hypothetical protein [Azospirillum canadense]MCW2239569.1 hypothetical protein [Azospirillum canadense]